MEGYQRPIPPTPLNDYMLYDLVIQFLLKLYLVFSFQKRRGLIRLTHYPD